MHSIKKMFDLNPNHYSLIVRGYHDPLKTYLKKHKAEIAEKKPEKSIEKKLTNCETVEQKKESVLPEKTEKKKESLMINDDIKPQKKSKGPSKQDQIHYQISEEENEQEEKKNGKNGFLEKVNGKKNENRMEISGEEENNEDLTERTRKRGRQPKTINSVYKDNHPLEVDDSDKEETLLYTKYFLLLLIFFIFYWF